ncbi:hypothetical protein IPA_06975 [Ignicoccus pacificus DSM 13166]|uniref:leucine--tRNA ligase n=1 Tax=Ignicoccus pacificus DSM 13166 TaxID=940294 RepID=A0A977KCJ8_9CREN|nr:hypothetical protein IPA_06975 [Ignicoccus pacificus DSM 13166]
MPEQKFFVTAAFPYALPFDLEDLYTRLRSFVIADAYAKYNLSLGKEVLFPMGFHYSGTPIVSFFEEVKKGNEEAVKKLKSLGVDPTQVESPKHLADIMAEKIRELLEKLQVEPDWSHSFNTEDPGYKSFVRWIFLKLKEKGLVEKGIYPVPWDPVEEMPISHHDTQGFKLPKIGQFYLLLFEVSPNTYLPAALRPETAFAVTNIWINPKSKYVLIDMNGKRMIVSEKAAFKLRHQIEGVVELGEVSPTELLGKRALNPITLERVPVLPSSHVDPNKGSGLVASTPAHNVQDYLALKEFLSSPTLLESFGIEEKEIKPKKVIEVPGEEDLLEKLLKEDPKEANRRLTLIERNKGRMICEEILKLAKGTEREDFFKGLLKVAICDHKPGEVAEIVKNATIFSGIAFVMYDIINGPIYSRFGNEVVVKILKDQWFLNYDNDKWKEEALEALGMTEFWPRDAKKVVAESIRTARKRAFTVTRGMGTELPWERGAIIDSLSDSTLYYMYYIFAPKVNGKELSPEEWDYLILGKGMGEIPEELKELRREFIKWMPLDMRIVHEGLLRSHVAYMYFHQAALLPPTQSPKRLISTGPVEGDLRDPWKVNGEALRLLLLTKAKPSSKLTIEKLEDELNSMNRMINQIKNLKGIETEEREMTLVDQWLLSELAKQGERFRFHMEQNQVREAALIAVNKMLDIAFRYLSRVADEGLKPSNVFKDFLEGWSAMLYPIMPKLAKEIGTGKWVEAERNLEAEAAEAYFDILYQTLKPYRGKRVTLVVAPYEKMKALRDALEAIDEGVWEDLEDMPKEIVDEAFKLGSDLRELVNYINEEELARRFAEVLKNKLGLEELKVEVGDTLPLKPLVKENQ